MLDLDLIPHGVKLQEGLAWLAAAGRRAGIGPERFLQVGMTPARRIFRESSVQVLKYERETPTTARHPILIIPSLINRHYVLDILPGKSLIEFLLAEGFPVYVIEWGAPEDEDRWLTLDRLVGGRLKRALQSVLEHEKADRVHLFGHCLGGTLAMIHALRYPERVASLSLLTSPMDFETGGQLAAWARHPVFDLDAFVEAYGNVPWPLMLASFHLLKPAGSVSKYLRAVKRLRDPSFARTFLALEAWGIDNISFPGACYKALIRELYRENALARGNVKLDGRPVRLEEISFPVLSIASLGDHIVPPEATLAERFLSRESLRYFTRWTTEGGHIGAILGRRAQSELWPRISEWLSRQGERAASAAHLSPLRPSDAPSPGAG
ncbi:MAG: alpha/beta fold hydrolase [Oligoflexia bacterium]|nr:alpha/beta fold hydrolase [Oligoflexia bacterium]